MSDFDGSSNFTDTDDDGDGSAFISSHPWFWIIVPICLLIVLIAFAAWVQARRRRNFRDPSFNQSSAAWSPWPRGGRRGGGAAAQVRGAPSQDVEAGPALHRDAAAPPTSRLNRWAWANRRPQDQADAEEGLNELGEAPPPYDGTKQGPPQLPRDGQVAPEAGPGQRPLQQEAAPAQVEALMGGWKAEAGEELQVLSPVNMGEVGSGSGSIRGSSAATETTTTALSGATRPSPPDYHSIVSGNDSGLVSPITTPTSGTATLASGGGGVVTRPPPAALSAERGSVRR